MATNRFGFNAVMCADCDEQVVEKVSKQKQMSSLVLLLFTGDSNGSAAFEVV